MTDNDLKTLRFHRKFQELITKFRRSSQGYKTREVVPSRTSGSFNIRGISFSSAPRLAEHRFTTNLARCLESHNYR
jgi:hypothetical protein